MRKLIVVAGVLLVGLTACRRGEQEATPGEKCPASGSGMVSGACPVSAHAGEQPAPAASSLKGKVTQTMNAGRYTYVAVDDGSGEKWAAAPTFEVKVGDTVDVQSGMLMKSFHSKSLDRTFPEILFAEAIANVTRAPAVAAPEVAPPTVEKPVCGKDEVLAARKPAKIAPPEGGKAIADVISERKELSGKTVTVRGKVVKYSAKIMGKNWIHLQDGSGKDGMADLAVTTDAVAKIGDIVTMTGTVVVDKDFGYGYRYDVLLEGATAK